MNLIYNNRAFSHSNPINMFFFFLASLYEFQGHKFTFSLYTSQYEVLLKLKIIKMFPKVTVQSF